MKSSPDISWNEKEELKYKGETVIGRIAWDVHLPTGLLFLVWFASSYPRCPWLSCVVPLEVLGALGSGGIYLLRLVPSLKLVSQSLKKHGSDIVYLQKTKPCIRKHFITKADRRNHVMGIATYGSMVISSMKQILNIVHDADVFVVTLFRKQWSHPLIRQTSRLHGDRYETKHAGYPEIKNLHLSRWGTERVCRVIKRMLHPVSCHSCIRRWGNNMVSQSLQKHDC
jgi:hypothetical protein